MTEQPLAEFKIKAWPSPIGRDNGPFYEILVKRRFAFATFYKRVSFALNLKRVSQVIQDHMESNES